MHRTSWRLHGAVIVSLWNFPRAVQTRTWRGWPTAWWTTESSPGRLVYSLDFEKPTPDPREWYLVRGRKMKGRRTRSAALLAACPYQ